MQNQSQSTASQAPDYASGVIWITGFSGAGKTTVARKVKMLLHEAGVNAVLLDGDDLRAIFSGKWGYSREERIELARAYFRLCSTLASQGITVIISAVAMYQEVFTWVKTNVDRSLQAYLRVPEEERLLRDSATKKVYSSIGDTAKLYDEPHSPDLIVDNHGAVSADIAALKIVTAYKDQRQSDTDKGRTAHWENFYRSSRLVSAPSSFAVEVQTGIGLQSVRILEIGCGNGRDSAYFAEHGHMVTAVDASSAAIEVCRKNYGHLPIQFLGGMLPELSPGPERSFDVVYSRFCLHAMTEKEEIANLKSAYRLLAPGGSLYLECRSINDPLARKGEVISPTERIYGHYRRFIVLDELRRRLENIGFAVRSSLEADNLAVLGDDNPVVLRVHACRF